jgi:hypothetical protein
LIFLTLGAGVVAYRMRRRYATRASRRSADDSTIVVPTEIRSL